MTILPFFTNNILFFHKKVVFSSSTHSKVLECSVKEEKSINEELSHFSVITKQKMTGETPEVRSDERRRKRKNKGKREKRREKR